MKVGTDGCLLGAWASHIAPLRVLDIGSGSGLLSLMLAQRYYSAEIDAVEIDLECAAQCRENAANSPWADRIHVYQSDVFQFKPKMPYDLIVSNPPYFNHAVQPCDNQRKLARHQVSLTVDELMKYAYNNLTEEGAFCLILPAENYFHAVIEAQKNHFFLAEKSDVQSLPGKVVNRVLLKFLKTQGALVINQIIIEESPGKYHDDFTRLLRDFYLNM